MDEQQKQPEPRLTETRLIDTTDYVVASTLESAPNTATEYVLVAPEAPRARPRVVVVGAGFAGLSAARALSGYNLDVLVLDRNNYHGFWPLLYQVATAGLEPEAIAYPVRAILRKHQNLDFHMASVTGVDFERKLVITDGAALPYDYLVLAGGSANNYFGNDALAHTTFGMKDINEAERLRNHVLHAFERAARERDPERRQALLTFVVVGGGPTGVELAGAFAELIRYVMRHDYPMLDIAQCRVILVEAIDRVLATFPERLQRQAQRQLERMGVEIRLNTAVAAVDAGRVTLRDGSQIESETVVWAAGVRAAPLADQLGLPQGRAARVKVTPGLNLPQYPEVFVVGDMAYLEGFEGDKPYPMVAPVAVQQGKWAARNILALIDGQRPTPFTYHNKGQMATIGRKSAVLATQHLHLSGFVAWLSWLAVHWAELIGFRNRLVVLANWLYNYVTYDRGIRIITRE
jgi:NADH dehydrogenase